MNCKNCKELLTPNNRYCQNCGARIPKNRLTISNLLQHFNATFLNFDNKFVQTVINLLKNPVKVIDSYVNGTRKKYMGPLELFAVTLTISGVYILVVQKYFPEAHDFSDFYSSEFQKEFTEKSMGLVMEYNSLIYFLFIPVGAVISWIVFLDKHYNFTEHLVMYFYTLSLFSLLSSSISLLVLSIAPEYYLHLSFFIYIAFFVYQCLIYKNLFSLSGFQLVLRILIFLPLFGIAYIIFGFFLLIITILFTDFNLQDLVPKKKGE